MKPAPEVRADQNLLSQLSLIYEHDFVFVRGANDGICGIVTTADLMYQFRDLTTPFFEVGEIERRLRRRINQVFTVADLRAATGSNKLNSADDMEYWQYIKLLGDDARWNRMGFDVDQVMFLDYLDGTRKVRNKVMHFGEELSDAERSELKECLSFIRAIDPLP